MRYCLWKLGGNYLQGLVSNKLNKALSKMFSYASLNYRIKTGPMVPLILLSLLSAALFSSTFVLNYAMALGEGHWVWTAVLRYMFTIVLLMFGLSLFKGWRYVLGLLELFMENPFFWVFAGSFACGIFYAGIAFSSELLRGWVVAATWQLTIIASPLILLAFGYKFPARGLYFALVVLFGVALVNVEHFFGKEAQLGSIWGFAPIIASAFAYPLGNQFLNSARNGGLSFVPRINSEALGNPFSGVFLLAIGSVPFWIALVIFVQPPAPSSDQYIQTFIVAALAGVLATAIFYYARNATSDPFKIIAVDAVQSSEVLFALSFELILVNSTLPSLIQFIGATVVVLGLVGYCWVPPKKS